ncbi:hypothetical protein Tco_1182562 [Tanacetum coccineum]
MTSTNDGYNGGAGGKLRKKAVTCAFWRRNHAVTEAPVTGTNEEQRNLGYISSATEISDIETMLIKKTFTRYEIEHLTTYRYEINEGDKANISKNSVVLRLKALKSGPLKKHAEERENLHALISILRAFPEDVASLVELARARSRGRKKMYRMARSPYYRGPSTLSKKPTPSLIEGSNGSKMVETYRKGRSSFAINYDLLKKGDSLETRFVLGKIILNTIGCGTDIHLDSELNKFNNHAQFAPGNEHLVNKKENAKQQPKLNLQLGSAPKKQEVIAKLSNIMQKRKDQNVHTVQQDDCQEGISKLTQVAGISSDPTNEV